MSCAALGINYLPLLQEFAAGSTLGCANAHKQVRGKMAKQLNGIFREWMRVPQADETAPPIIWGNCIVHLSNPEFCGLVLHTSGVLSIAVHKTLLIAETRNNYYALLGPELFMPADCEVDPETYPNGRFALTHDPEGNPIQLWQPKG